MRRGPASSIYLVTRPKGLVQGRIASGVLRISFGPRTKSCGRSQETLRGQTMFGPPHTKWTRRFYVTVFGGGSLKLDPSRLNVSQRFRSAQSFVAPGQVIITSSSEKQRSLYQTIAALPLQTRQSQPFLTSAFVETEDFPRDPIRKAGFAKLRKVVVLGGGRPNPGRPAAQGTNSRIANARAQTFNLLRNQALSTYPLQRTNMLSNKHVKRRRSRAPRPIENVYCTAAAEHREKVTCRPR